MDRPRGKPQTLKKLMIRPIVSTILLTHIASLIDSATLTLPDMINK